MFRLVCALVLLGSTLISAQTTSTARFQHERLIDVASPGPQRLDVDVAVLSGSQPFVVRSSGERSIAEGGLNDLRLFAADGAEVPYLLMPPPADAPVFITGRVLPITAVDTPNAKASGFEVDLEMLATVDAIDLNRMPAPFLKRFRLEGSGDRTRWTQLIAEGTAFNLPAERLSHTRIEFQPGDYRYLRVTWDDTNSARVAAPDLVQARRVTGSLHGPVLRVPLTITETPSEPGRSRFRLSLPAARLPIVALELTVGGGHLSRTATVFESRLAGDQAQPHALGSEQLVRVMRDGMTADALRIPIRQPNEVELELVVDDGDNPRLALQGVTAILAELPWIYFETAGGPITARYGDPRLAAPRYDLEAARNAVPLAVSSAAWRSDPPRTLATIAEGLPMPPTGSALTVEGYEFVRDIAPGPSGLISIPLDAAAVAHSATTLRRLNDIRVIDRAGLQIPYLIERRDGPLVVDVAVERRDLPTGLRPGVTNATTYVVKVPYNKLPDARLVLTTRARVFKRTVMLGSTSTATERQPERFFTYATLPWVHADDAVAAPSLAFNLPESIDRELLLVVEEGDNQPLPIEKAALLLPSYALRLFRPANQPLRLLYGKDGVDPPRYDLQLLAPQLMGRRAEEAPIGVEQRFAAATAAIVTEVVSPTVFWVALSLAVLVLITMVAKLMRREAV